MSRRKSVLAFVTRLRELCMQIDLGARQWRCRLRSPYRVRRLNRVQLLEDRALLATFVVTGTGNSGAGTLRWAIEQSNAAFGQDQIHFNIPGSGVQSIKPTTALPAIIETVIIDGTTQPGWSGSPLIELNGSLAGASQTGLSITGSFRAIEHFNQNNFTTAVAGYNIRTVNFDNITAANNINGATAFAADGLTVAHRDGKPLNIVPVSATSLPAVNFNSQPNGISSGFGANSLSYPTSSENSDNLTFTLPAPAFAAGLWIGNLGSSSSSASTTVEFLDANNVVVASESLSRTNTNTILGTGVANNRLFYGVVLTTAQISTVRVTNAASNSDAILVDDVQFATTNPSYPGPSGSIIRGLAVNAWTSNGISVTSSNNWVTQCHIGTNAAGLAAVPNVTGLSVNGTANTIGTNLDGTNDGNEGNLISGNSTTGIDLPGTGNQNRIAGNLIGPDISGNVVLPGQDFGVRVGRYSSNLQIGGPRG
ncbi:MAG: hypothetical protein WCK86_23495, partial [Planctomycetia bacterium]